MSPRSTIAIAVTFVAFAWLPAREPPKVPGRLRRANALPACAIGPLQDYLRAARGWRRLRSLERICLEQARLCRLPETKAAYEEIARNYR
jgi:hypothetical protein